MQELREAAGEEGSKVTKEEAVRILHAVFSELESRGCLHDVERVASDDPEIYCEMHAAIVSKMIEAKESMDAGLPDKNDLTKTITGRQKNES